MPLQVFLLTSIIVLYSVCSVSIHLDHTLDNIAKMRRGNPNLRAFARDKSTLEHLACTTLANTSLDGWRLIDETNHSLVMTRIRSADSTVRTIRVSNVKLSRCLNLV